MARPSTAYLYDWNILPIGQLLWEKELLSYKDFPPMQAPETYNLDGILSEMKRPEPSERVTEARYRCARRPAAGPAGRPLFGNDITASPATSTSAKIERQCLMNVAFRFNGELGKRNESCK